MMLAEVLGVSQLDVTHIVLALPVLDKSPSVSVELTLTDVVGHIALELDICLGVRSEG